MARTRPSQKASRTSAGRQEARLVTLISRKELERMKAGTQSPESLQLAARKAQLEAAEAAQQEREKVEAMKQREPLSELDKAQAEKDAAVRAKAALQLEEERDEVKRMNQMLLYSKCAAIRDQQVEEKKRRQAEEASRQLLLDQAIERRRQNQLAALEEERKVQFERQRAGMAILEEQLEEHEQQKKQAEAQKREEQARINQAIQLAKEQDARQAAARRTAGAALLKEITTENAVQIQRKKAERALEVEEDMRRFAYTKAQDAKARAVQEEAARHAKARELETARLRAAQEKVLDTRAQLDELRARRWQEAAGRREREHERLAAEKKAAAVAAVAEARSAQAASKLVAQATLAKAEAADFKSTIRRVREEQAALKAQEALVAAKKKEYLAELQKQVEAKAAGLQDSRAAALAQGQLLKAKIETEKQEIERIRQKKLQLMADDSIPDRYRAKLAREKFTNDALRASK